MKKGSLVIAGKEFASRLFVGTGKFSSSEAMRASIEASGSQMVTVALRRVDISNPSDDVLAHINRDKVQLLPNTSGARDAKEAVRVAMLAREASGVEWLKLEVTPDPYYLLPDPIETFKAAEILVKEGFKVLPYINADPILCRHLEDIGCSTVMPLGSPIGSNQGIKTRANLKIIIRAVQGAGGGGCGPGPALPRGRRHGNGRGRRPGQHCAGGRPGSCRNGGCLPYGGRGRTHGLRSRTGRDAHSRRGVQPVDRVPGVKHS